MSPLALNEFDTPDVVHHKTVKHDGNRPWLGLMPYQQTVITLMYLYCLAVAILPLTAICPWNLFCRNHSRVFI